MKKIKLLSIIITISILFSACSFPGFKQKAQGEINVQASADVNYPVELKDFSGKKVALNKKPEKIVSLSPAVTEIIYDLGYGQNIIGVTDEVVYPAEVKGKQKVGSYADINIDLITSLNPDIVFASKYTYQHMAEKFREQKITVVFAEAETYNGIFESVNMISKIFAEKEKGDKINEGIKQKIVEISDKTSEYKPNVLFIQSIEPPYAAGSKTLINDVIWLAGGANAVQDLSGYAEIDGQKLNGRKVDKIVLSSTVGNDITVNYLKSHILFKDLDAVKNNRVIKISKDELFMTPSPRITEAIEEMYKLIYGVKK